MQRRQKAAFWGIVTKKSTERVVISFFYTIFALTKQVARVAKLVDAPDLGSGVLRRVGSSPITRTIEQKRNSQKKRVPLFLRIDNASSKRSREAPQNVVPRGLRKASVVNFTIRIDNASSKRSREAPRQWCRVGCEKRVLSILLSESTMPTAVGQTKDGRSSYRLGRDKAALSI